MKEVRLLCKNKKKISISFWIQILSIFLIGVMATGIVFLLALEEKSSGSKAHVANHTVTFAYQDGNVIAKKNVDDGEGVFPPILESNGVFRGWSAGFNAVKADIEVHPVFYTIKEENLFYFDSIYVKEGSEFTLDLYVGGKVNISSATITLSYDTDVLEYKKSNCIEGLAISENKEGELTITFNSNTPLKDKTLLSKITFYAKKKDAYYTQVNLAARDVQILVDGKAQPAICATINNKIYFLQEVSE